MDRCLLLQGIYPFAVFHTLASDLLVSVIAMTLIFTSQASEELNYAPTWLSRQCCKATHVRLSVVQSTLCAQKNNLKSVVEIDHCYKK